MSFTGREVILGNEFPKPDTFAVSSAVQLTQFRKTGKEGGKEKKKKTPNQNLLQEQCKTKLCMRARDGKAGQGKDKGGAQSGLCDWGKR